MMQTRLTLHHLWLCSTFQDVHMCSWICSSLSLCKQKQVGLLKRQFDFPVRFSLPTLSSDLQLWPKTQTDGDTASLRKSPPSIFSSIDSLGTGSGTEDRREGEVDWKGKRSWGQREGKEEDPCLALPQRNHSIVLEGLLLFIYLFWKKKDKQKKISLKFELIRAVNINQSELF